MQDSVARMGFLGQRYIGSLGGAIGVDGAHPDQAVAVLRGVKGRVEGLVDPDYRGRYVGGDGVSLGANVQFAALQHHEVYHVHRRVGGGAER